MFSAANTEMKTCSSKQSNLHLLLICSMIEIHHVPNSSYLRVPKRYLHFDASRNKHSGTLKQEISNSRADTLLHAHKVADAAASPRRASIISTLVKLICISLQRRSMQMERIWPLAAIKPKKKKYPSWGNCYDEAKTVSSRGMNAFSALVLRT